MMGFRTRKGLATLAIAAGALLALPAPAKADRDHRDRERHHHGHHGRAVPVYRHGAHCAPYHVHPGAYRPAREYHAHPYHCRPCSQRFRSWQSFERHAHHHHRVAPWRLPRLLVRSAGFWLFLG